jgi:hypothetical protein
MSMKTRRALAAMVTAVMAAAGCQRAASEPTTLTLTMPGRAGATPWVAASGSFVAVAWGATNAEGTDVVVAVSEDAGRTFAPPVRVNQVAGEARLGGELPPRVAVTARAGSSQPEIAVLWTARAETTEIKSARSRDGGRTFDAPQVLQAAAAPGMRGWPALALDRSGTAHSIWLDHRGLTAGTASQSGHEQHRGEHDGVAMAQKSGLFYSSGASASGEHELTKGVCFCCKTALAAGPDGTLFAAWRHVYEGNMRDIALTVSRDGGKTFAAPVRVSEDKWAINGCPDDGPAIAVDEQGTAHLVWPTVIGGENPEGALFYSSTPDGEHFTPRVRVPTLGSPKPTHPQIAIDPTGRVVVAWDELVQGRRNAVARVLTRGADGSPTFGEVITLDTDGAAVYPVLAATSRGLVAVWTTGSGEQSAVRARQLNLE